MVWKIAKLNFKFNIYDYYLNLGGIKMKTNINTKKWLLTLFF